MANQVPKEIRLEIENLPRPQSAHTGFLCIVNIEGAHMSLPARVESKKFIVCEKTTYSYEAATNEYEARVDILWNRNHYIDTVPIILYKCDVLGSHREHADCSLCVTRPSKYQCTWCGTTCMYNETCSAGMAVNECPRPRIDMVRITKNFSIDLAELTMFLLLFSEKFTDKTVEWPHGRWHPNHN